MKQTNKIDVLKYYSPKRKTVYVLGDVHCCKSELIIRFLTSKTRPLSTAPRISIFDNGADDTLVFFSLESSNFIEIT